jgi:excisionase family DNA binding protein
VSEKLYTLDEVARLFRCSVRHVLNLRKAGLLACRKLGSRVLFTEEDIQSCLERMKERPANGLPQ